MKKIKNEKAITLIALVITIIVLLILAGVAISMLTGDNGILKKAVEAKEKTERESLKEQIQTDILSEQMKSTDGDTNLSKEVLEGILKKYGTLTYDEEENLKGVLPQTGDEILLSEVYDGKELKTWSKTEDGKITNRKGITLEIGDIIKYNSGIDSKGNVVNENYTSEKENNGNSNQIFKATSYKGEWGVLGMEDGKIMIMTLENVTTESNDD